MRVKVSDVKVGDYILINAGGEDVKYREVLGVRLYLSARVITYTNYYGQRCDKTFPASFMVDIKR